MTTDFRALCAELVEELHGYASANPFLNPDALVARARTALAEPQGEGPTQKEAVAIYSEVMAVHDCQTVGNMAEHFAHAVLARWGRPTPPPERLAPQPVPVTSDAYFEFAISGADGCTQAGGIAPTYAQALSEGQHYLAQYQQDGPHTLELRRVEVLNPDALPLPAGEVE